MYITPKKLPQNKNISTRKDGDITRKTLIECAGHLIAKQGYTKTTSKSICSLAKANVAAINYHFGSRDNLYKAVLEEVHRYLLNIKDLEEIAKDNISAKEKLSLFFDTVAQNMWQDKGWQVKVWAREVIDPSPFIYQILNKNAIPKFLIITKIFSEYTGLSPKNPELYSCMLSTLAPFAIIFLTKHKSNLDYKKIFPINYYTLEKLLVDFKRFAFAGLDAFREKIE